MNDNPDVTENSEAPKRPLDGVVSCPRCEGKGVLEFAEPGEPFDAGNGLRLPTTRHRKGTCPDCMGHKKVTELQARIIEGKIEAAYQRFLDS